MTEHLEEREAIRTSIRELLTVHADDARLQRAWDSQEWSGELWSRLCEMGAGAVAVPERLGGLGLGFAEELIVVDELAARLIPSPHFSSIVLAARTLLECGDAAAEEWLSGPLSGETTAAVVLKAGDFRAEANSAGWRISGAASPVVDAATADFVILAASTHDGPSLFAVDRGAAGLMQSRIDAFDGSRPLGGVRCEEVAATLIASPDSAAAVIDRVSDIATIALAAEQRTAARAALDRTVEYAKFRTQFGRTIGSFQAIKHRLADHLTDWHAVDASVGLAARAVDDDAQDLALMASSAASLASECFSRIAADMIQIHGGIGMTWEHEAHRYFRRAKASSQLLASPAAHRERIAAALLD